MSTSRGDLTAPRGEEPAANETFHIWTDHDLENLFRLCFSERRTILVRGFDIIVEQSQLCEFKIQELLVEHRRRKPELQPFKTKPSLRWGRLFKPSLALSRREEIAAKKAKIWHANVHKEIREIRGDFAFPRAETNSAGVSINHFWASAALYSWIYAEARILSKNRNVAQKITVDAAAIKSVEATRAILARRREGRLLNSSFAKHPGSIISSFSFSLHFSSGNSDSTLGSGSSPGSLTDGFVNINTIYSGCSLIAECTC